MTKKVVILLLLLVPTLVSVLAVISWRREKLFWRVGNATIDVNGERSSESELFRSRDGQFFIFTKDRSNQFTTYVVVDGQKPTVGIPASAVPSGSTKSVKTRYFLLCLDCKIVAAGTDKFDRNATVTISSNALDFQIYGNTVAARF